MSIIRRISSDSNIDSESSPFLNESKKMYLQSSLNPVFKTEKMKQDNNLDTIPAEQDKKPIITINNQKIPYLKPIPPTNPNLSKPGNKQKNETQKENLVKKDENTKKKVRKKKDEQKNGDGDDNKSKLKTKKKKKLLLSDIDKKIFKKMKIRPIYNPDITKKKDIISAKFFVNHKTPDEERFKFLKIIRIPPLEYTLVYKDRFPLLYLRKKIWRISKIFSKICYTIVKSPIFENLTLLIIIWNSIMLGFYDPISEVSAYPSVIDDIFLGYYTAEMILKIIGFGFLLSSNAYMRDPWNILDFVIVITAYIPIVIGGGSGGVDLRGLRSLRILRPLRTISTIKSLRVIVSTILQSLPYMIDIILVAFFSFYIYAIVGLQLFRGYTKNRCIDTNTGIPVYNSAFPEINYQQYCGAWPCSPDLGLPGMNLVCAKMIQEPYYGITNFGTILWSLLNVYQCITQEGWSATMIIIQQTWGPWAAIYFISLSFVGAYYLMNLIMAVITAIFEMNSNQDEESLKVIEKKSHEKTLLALINKNKIKIIDVIRRYHYGTLPYHQIQFIHGKLYFFDPKNPKLKEYYESSANNKWGYLIQQLIRSSKQPIRPVKKKTSNFIRIVEKAREARLLSLISPLNVQTPQPYMAKPLPTADAPNENSTNAEFKGFQFENRPSIDNINQSSSLNPLKPRLDTLEKKDSEFSEKKFPEVKAETKEENQIISPRNDQDSKLKAKSLSNRDIRNLNKRKNEFQAKNKRKDSTVENGNNVDKNSAKISQKFGDIKTAEIKSNENSSANENPIHLALYSSSSQEEKIEEQIQEYFDEDLSSLQLGKDRFLVNIKDLKINLNDDPVQSKIDSLKDVLPTYHIIQKEKEIQKETKLHLKARLYPIYQLGEVKSGEQKKETKKQKRPKFELPMKNIDRYADIIRKYSRIFTQRANKIYDQALVTSPNKLNRDNNSILLSESDELFKPKSTKAFTDYKSFMQIHRIFFNPEANMDLLYPIVKSKIDDDNQIEPHEIFQSQYFEYFDAGNEYSTIKKNDLEVKSIKFRNWSGHDILIRSYIISQINKIKAGLMKEYESIWLEGYLGLIHAFRRKIKQFCNSEYFSTIMILVVITNTIFIASVGLVPDYELTSPTAENADKIFSIIFIIEMGLKLIGLGPIDYISDNINILDASTVLVSIIDLSMQGSQNGLKAFKAVRILRGARVLRLAKLLRAFKFMRFLVTVLAKTFKDFMSVLFLMLVFIYIYALLGMQILGGIFNYPDNVGWYITRGNYDTLPQALIATFQVMTMENWNNILFFAERSSAGYYLPFFYLLSWIIIGNYILLNLFMAMLLAQFNGDETEEERFELQESDEPLEKDDEGDNFEFMKIAARSRLHFTLTHPKLIENGPKGDFQKLNPGRSSTINLFLEEEEIPSKNGRITIYEGNNCNRSLYIFKKKWKFRRLCYRISIHPWTEWLILLVILASSIKLALDTYIDANDPTASNLIIISSKLDIAIIGFFTLESVIKIIAFGLILDTGAYMKDYWNCLDLFIVLVGLVDITSSQVNISFIKILRLLRILRPLRLLTHNKSMRLMVAALIKSFNGILNTALVILLIILIFAMFGVNILRNRLGICDVSSNPLLSRYNVDIETCTWMGYNWRTWDMNWDNVFRGMLSLFVASTQEGWPDYMFRCIDSADPDTGPIKNNNLWIFIYFAVFILVGSGFLVNLFVGVIMFQYGLAEQAEKQKFIYLTEEQEKWIEIQKMLLHVKPNVLVKPTNCYQKFWGQILNTNLFEFIIMMCVIANMIILSLNYDEETYNYSQKLKFINYAFTGVFIIEMLGKISAYGLKIYFMDNWNKFDAFVVVASIVDISIDNLTFHSVKLLRIAPQLLRTLRLFRVNRLIRLSNKLLKIQKLVKTIVNSLPAMSNAFALVILAFYIYAICATFLFSEILSGDQIGIYLNFLNFSNSIVTLFVCATGENWFVIMFDTTHPTQCIDGTSDCAPNLTATLIFWISFILIVKYTVLSLLIMIIVDLFSDVIMDENNPLNKFIENVENFKIAWETFSKKNNGLFLKKNQIIQFFLKLEEPLGFKKDDDLIEQEMPSKQTMAREIMKMNIRMSTSGKVTFHELLYASFKHAYGNITEKRTKSNELMKLVEERTLKKIDKLESNMNSMDRTTTCKVAVANPLSQLLFVGMTLRAWQNYTQKHYNEMPIQTIDEMSLSSDNVEDDGEIGSNRKNKNSETFSRIKAESKINNESEINTHRDKNKNSSIINIHNEELSSARLSVANNVPISIANIASPFTKKNDQNEDVDEMIRMNSKDNIKAEVYDHNGIISGKKISESNEIIDSHKDIDESLPLKFNKLKTIFNMEAKIFNEPDHIIKAED